MANPSTIMGASAISWVDVAEGGMFQNSNGTTAAGDGDPVGYLPDLVSGAYTADNTGWRPTLRENNDDPYLEGSNSSLYRALSRSGPVYAVFRARFPDISNWTTHLAVFGTDLSSFWADANWFVVRKVNDVDSSVIHLENGSAGGDVVTQYTRDVFETFEIYFDGTNAAVAVNGGSFVTASSPAVSSAYLRLFGGLSGGDLDNAAWGRKDIRRGAVINTVPTSGQRAALLDWAENGDAGGDADDLLADSLSSVSTVGTPSLGQSHSLAPDSLQSASSVSLPALGQSHALTAGGVASASEVTSPALGQVYAVAADDLEAASEVTAPSLAQVHVLHPASLNAPSSVGSPALAQDHDLTATNLSSASDVSEPGIGQTHILTAANINATSTVSSPAIRQAGELVALDLAALSEVSQPGIAQVHVLSAANLDSAATVSTTPLAQVYHLTADDLSAVSEVSQPVLTPGASGLTAEDLEAASEVSHPALGQVHHLAAIDLSAASEVSRPALGGQQHNTVMIRWTGLWQHRRDIGIWHRRRDVGIWHQRKITGRWRRA